MKNLLFLLTLWVSCLEVHAQSYAELTQKAFDALERDSLADAEKYLLQALKVDPAHVQNSLLFSNLGLIQQRQGKLHEALESYNMALNITPKMVPILLNRAALYLELGKNDLARIDYSMVLDIEPKNLEALLMRAYAYSNLNDYKSAQSDYERLLTFSPMNYKGRLGLALSLKQLGMKQEALNELTAMIASKTMEDDKVMTDEKLSVVFSTRANIEIEQEQIDLAIFDLGEAIRLDPGQTENYLVRGQLYLMQKKKELARKDFETAVSYGVPSSMVHDLLKSTK